MRTLLSLFATALLIVVATRPASADVPDRVPVQGFLTSATGTPIDGPTQISFRLYPDAAGGTAWYTETQVVQVSDGAFTAYLGTVTPLDVTTFRSTGAFLGITVAGDSEMTPRLEMATVPYAAYAQETAAVPPGAVMFFDLDACPSGWSALDAARGRTLVGVPTGGMRGATVGTAYADRENRTHAHSVDPAAATTTSDGAHTHLVDPVSVTSASTAVDHTHGIDPPATDSTSYAHGHAWARWDWTNKDWYTYNAAGAEFRGVDYSDGMSNTGSDQYPFQTADTSHTVYTSRDTHSHNVNIGSFASAAATTTAHTHAVDVASTVSSTASAHTHQCDAPATTSSAVSATAPYLQLLICRKD